jgi:uncharacterized protein YutD
MRVPQFYCYEYTSIGFPMFIIRDIAQSANSVAAQLRESNPKRVK